MVPPCCTASLNYIGPTILLQSAGARGVTVCPQGRLLSYAGATEAEDPVRVR